MDQKQLMEDIISYWNEHDCFQQSIETRSSDRPFTFYDGPPFASGDPHYGHLLASSIKDAIPRYMTMRGYRVERKRGWDCHGLPAENYVEKQLGIQGRKEIEEKVGIETFVEACRTAVMQVNENWKWFVDHVGRWVDIDNAYFTMSQDFMESVMWVFSEMYAQNLIYKGFKIQGYCPNCATPLSNYEITQGYEDKQDPAVTVKFRLNGEQRKKSEEQRKKYAVTDDGFMECAVGLIKDKEGRYLLVYHQKEGLRFFPGGKPEGNETFVEALHREVEEEIGVQVIKENLLGQVKIIHLGKPRRVHYYEIEIEGEPTIQETDKHAELKRVSSIESDNDLGFAMKIDEVIIDDVEQIQREFVDYCFLQQGIFEHKELADASMHLLPRTTTPWTLPANMFAAVGEEIMYVILFDKTEKEYYILGEQAVSKYYKDADDYLFIYRLPGKELVGLSYEPLFDYYYQSAHIAEEYHDQVHTVLAADFVTAEDGTGVAHEAPAFGEDDYQLVIQHLPQADAKNWLFAPVNEFGEYTDEIPEWQGQRVYEANKEVIQAIKDKGKLVHQATINHSYPHCRRCDTPLIYKAIDGWFIKETQMKEDLVASAEEITFVPAAVKKRFINGLAGAPDWNVSRNRFRGSPIPVWECHDCEERVVCGTIAEIETLGGQKVEDLHKPYIDEITIPCKGCGKDMQRTPEVLDCWFESGSMPYGQAHYLGENTGQDPSTTLRQAQGDNSGGQFNNTANFIAEGLDQTRGWFRTLHVIGNAIHSKKAFENVIVNGMILAEDGKKMSKRLKNYPDPKVLLEKYGGDAFRLYVLGSPVVRGEPLRFVEQGVEQVLKDFVLPLQNVWNFFTMYAKVDGWKDSGTEVYRMRHAESNGQHETASLTPNGLYSLEDQDFIERVLRINPDIIITSPRERAYDTGVGAQKILKKYLHKDVDVQSSERLVSPTLSEETIDKAWTEISQLTKGKRVLIVSHQKRFRVVWKYLFGIEKDIVEDKELRQPYQLDNTEIVKLPSIKLENELDQWVLAEIYKTIDEVDKYLKSYELEPAVRALMAFMDKLTNRYLRRSRRRFRAQGMDADKQAAYWTLFEVLGLYCKIAAPFAPFVSEWVWQEMEVFRQQTADNKLQKNTSVHLQYRPLYSEKWVNEQLVEEIATVRKIIKGAMYLRAKHQVKVKQPLQRLSFTL